MYVCFCLFGALELGLLYGLVALGVYLTFRVLDFPDLSVDGSFPMGAAVAATAIVAGINPWVATGLAILAGAAKLGHGFSECAMWYLASLGLDFDHDCCVFHQHPHYGTS